MSVAIIEQPTLDSLKDQANAEHAAALEAGQSMLHHAIKCGEHLVAIRQELPSRTWWSWLEHNFAGSQVTANLYVRLATYQEHLEGKDIGIKAAQRLLSGMPDVNPRALPPEIREKAVALHREGMSFRRIAKTLDVSARETGVGVGDGRLAMNLDHTITDTVRDMADARQQPEPACFCGDEDCDYLAFGYPYCRSCGEHHRLPECPVDQDGVALRPDGLPWDARS